MCDPVTLTIIAVGVAGGTKAYSQYKQGSATNKYYQYQADQTRKEGEAAFRIGQKQSELVQDASKNQIKAHKLNAAEFESSQRAALVANGIDLSSVTSENLQSDSFRKSRLDELNLRFNSDLSSWDIMETARQKRWASQVKADEYSYAGKSAKSAGKTQAFVTLVSTAASMATAGSGLFSSGAPGAGTAGISPTPSFQGNFNVSSGL